MTELLGKSTGGIIRRRCPSLGGVSVWSCCHPVCLLCHPGDVDCYVVSLHPDPLWYLPSRYPLVWGVRSTN